MKFSGTAVGSNVGRGDHVSGFPLVSIYVRNYSIRVGYAGREMKVTLKSTFVCLKMAKIGSTITLPLSNVSMGLINSLEASSFLLFSCQTTNRKCLDPCLGDI